MPSQTVPKPIITHEDAERLGEALRFAAEQHGRQARKNTSIPYVSHLLQVAGLVLEHGGTVDQAIAGLLHDVVEDCDVRHEEIARRFGGEVSAIVHGCTDLLEGDTPGLKGDWRTRKERYIAHIGKAGAATVLVSACDKVHNLATLVADVRRDGPGYLQGFSSTPAQQVWYFGAFRAAVAERLPPALAARLDALVEEFSALAAARP